MTIDDFDLDVFDEDEWVELVLEAVREQWAQERAENARPL